MNNEQFTDKQNSPFAQELIPPDEDEITFNSRRQFKSAKKDYKKIKKLLIDYAKFLNQGQRLSPEQMESVHLGAIGKVKEIYRPKESR